MPFASSRGHGGENTVVLGLDDLKPEIRAQIQSNSLRVRLTIEALTDAAKGSIIDAQFVVFAYGARVVQIKPPLEG